MGKMKQRPDYSPGSFGCHEALHMTQFLAMSVDVELTRHPSIMANEEWARLAQEAHDALITLYSAIGNEHLK